MGKLILRKGGVAGLLQRQNGELPLPFGREIFLLQTHIAGTSHVKNIKKLAEIGYIEIVGDKKDKRVKHLYLTAKYQPESMAQNGGTPWKRMKANNSHHKREL